MAGELSRLKVTRSCLLRPLVSCCTVGKNRPVPFLPPCAQLTSSASKISSPRVFRFVKQSERMP